MTARPWEVQVGDAAKNGGWLVVARTLSKVSAVRLQQQEARSVSAVWDWRILNGDTGEVVEVDQ